MKEVRCKSGLMGWQCHLQCLYKSFEEFQGYCGLLGLHTRLKFRTPEDAWKVNPLIQGSVTPSDYRRVQEWFTWCVRYWSHENDHPEKPINDCYGNSIEWTGKARTQPEAINRAKKFSKQSSPWFRVHSVVQKIA